jgi:hypothetical protein
LVIAFLNELMKKASLSFAAISGVALLVFATSTFGANADKGKARTVTGEAKCAKCALKEAEKCQTVIQVENKKGKTVNYYLTDNEVSKAFHKTVCEGPSKVTATGTLKKVHGKNEFTVSRIDPVK